MLGRSRALGKPVATTLVVLGALVSFALPTALSVHLAWRQALDEQFEVARAHAEDLVQRADAIADEADEALRALAAIADPDQCSDARLAAMRNTAVAQGFEMLGAVSGDALVCSSLGKSHPVALGPASFVTARGVRVRPNTALPFSRDRQFLVLEEHGFAVVIHKDSLLGLAGAERQVSRALYARSNGMALASRGYIDEDWLHAMRSGPNVTTLRNGYAIAARQSRRYDIGAIVAIPLQQVDERIVRIAAFLVPVGVLAGLVLAWCVVHIARLRLSLATSISLALARREFFLVFQPVVELATGRWVGAEALIRWRRRDGEIVRPDLFIPQAEESGLIVQITEQVVGLIGREAGGLFDAFPDFHIALNLSAADLHDIDTPMRLRRLAAKTRARPGSLIAEVTERAFVHTDRARSVLEELRQFNVASAIDDFGTGYSSLSHLESLPLDYLKIDKTFVDSLATESVTSHVIHHIIEMAKSLKLKMIAEGVETEVQAGFLREHGVEYAQGWLFGKPMAFADLLAELKRQREAC
jgi:sensor c-di-GMP phosphodiesterase-like protein